MIRFFSMDTQDESNNSPVKTVIFTLLMILIIGSFFLQMSMGICPVP
ncbi:hypothetical protein [Fodinibius saliphilus]|nr:hypothetical protein [Fodinibius saliphilus]